MAKILVVDDEKDVCDFVHTFFKSRGFEVLCALNGYHALDLLKKEKPDLVLLDVRMKGMDGMETLKKIRETDKNVKVVMVTAADEKETIDAAGKLGVKKYITKPLALDELENTVLAYARKT